MSLREEGTLGGRRFATKGKQWVCLECETRTAANREKFEAHKCPAPKPAATAPAAAGTTPENGSKG